ncbi:MAG: phosphate ABC transporter permease PstA, partial [Panacagrimonas sp.]
MAEQTLRRSAVLDSVATFAAWSAFALVAAVFAWMLGDVLLRGASALSWDFLWQEPAKAGRAGGIAPIIVSTLLIVGVAMLVTAPLGLACALWLSEYARLSPRAGRAVRASLDVLAGMPSIVFGLFGNALFCVVLGMGFSILSGCLTLACMALPLLIRATEQGLRAVPDDYRQAAAALGVSRWTVTLHVLLPAAVPGLIAGLVLGIGRALAETAALIFTSGYVDRMPSS